MGLAIASECGANARPIKTVSKDMADVVGHHHPLASSEPRP